MKLLDKMSKKDRKEYFKKFRSFWTINPETRREPKNKWKVKRDKSKTKTDMEE